jgi:hypothetical protein
MVAGCGEKPGAMPELGIAINDYYQAHPACLWTDEKRFPVQVAISASSEINSDVLVNQGLLTRISNEKKGIVKSQVNQYDLADKGRVAWIADPDRHGFGNLCFGHLRVSSIFRSGEVSEWSLSLLPVGRKPTPKSASDPSGASAEINYLPQLTRVPNWASTSEVQAAFPALKAALSTSQAATATLIHTPQGWKVTAVRPASSNAGGSRIGP